jgi:nitroreductase
MSSIPLENIYKILESGSKAPSGSNSQPWKFKISGNQIEILALPERDHPVLNFRNRGTWVAHGALIENLLIAASTFGYKATLELLPLSPLSKITARLTLFDNGEPSDELFNAINLRVTNRKPYTSLPLTEQQKNKLFAEAKKIGQGELKLIEDQNIIKILAKASSMNEVILLENHAMHELFFKEIVWTETEEKQQRTGLYLKTMELEPPQEKALRLFKKWGLMKFFNLFGAAKAIAKTNEKSYVSSPAIGAIIINNSDDAFLAAGRIMQRVWLEATNLGLSSHLMAGILFFAQRVEKEPDSIFSIKHQKLIAQAYKNIAQALEINEPNKTVALLIRIGNGGKPSGTSSRFPIKQITEIVQN